MGTRIQSHKLSGGLYVSGPEQHLKERQPTMGSRPIYTGGDVKKSGELGKMFDIHVADPSSSINKPSSSSKHNSGSIRSGPNSGSIPTKPTSSNSGPLKKSSGPIPTPLQPTGLITSGPLNSSGGSIPRRSGQLEQSASMGKATKAGYGAAITNVGGDLKLGFNVPKVIVWVFGVVALMGLVVGVFMMMTVKNVIILGVVGACLVPVVTCGSIPLESSYQRIPRCAYVSTELFEYRGWGGKPANSKHCPFSWGLRYFEKNVGDFYISDFQSGLRALVKAGCGAKVAPFVKSTTVADITKENRDMSPNFLRWLADHNLSSDDRIMRLKEGYIKEGSTVSVMGIVERHDNVLMIIPSPQPISAGCQWLRFLLPTYIEGLILKCDDTQNSDVIPV
ncbi:hypothetical protein GIB67_026905 [Kingdonia uniflora]|uniref:Ubiquitin-specific protease family C19-related protein n=1 Tax=Kingdonia uniflora TaxID=39325 RepID=A0A7J7P1K6_9MAGN|nr:hypothetical protein GIB67_026905 [Kingdonia uniflora]